MGSNNLTDHLPDYSWQDQYETEAGESLVEEFYVPALKRSKQYDRITGYFSSGSLAMAAEGVYSLVESGVRDDGGMRMLVGAELSERDKPALTGQTQPPTDSLASIALDDELDDPGSETAQDRLRILAWLLDRGFLTVKIGIPRQGKSGIFHSKFGLFHDSNDNTISFEGSLNETPSGWSRNYERFKVHRSWKDGQSGYVQKDEETFRKLWQDEHSYVDVFDLPEALEAELIKWKPGGRGELDQAVRRLKGDGSTQESGADNPLKQPDEDGVDPIYKFNHGHMFPGGTHLAEESSVIDPWPHQRTVADTVFNNYPQGYLFCDQVGLGKTIEVGLTLSRLRLTGEISNGLLLVPGGLVNQWQSELWEKFNFEVYRCEKRPSGYQFYDALGHRQDEGGCSTLFEFVEAKNNNGEAPVILASWHMARLEQNHDDFLPDGEPELALRSAGSRLVDRSSAWDVVAVDEAHNARRERFTERFPDDTPNNLLTFLRKVSDKSRCTYLATATPMQMHPVEMYDLLDVVGLPEAWQDERDFLRYFETRKKLRLILNSETEDSTPSENNVLKALDEKLLMDFGDETPPAMNRLLQACSMVRGLYENEQGRAHIQNRLDNASLGLEKDLKTLFVPDDEQRRPVDDSDREQVLRAMDDREWALMLDILDEMTPIETHVHRYTREKLREYNEDGVMDQTVPERDIDNRYIELEGRYREVYDEIEDYVTEFYEKIQEVEDENLKALGFVMTIYRQRLTSSLHAISKSLKNRLKSLEKKEEVLDSINRGHSEEDEEAGAKSGITKDELMGQIPETDEEAAEILEEDIEKIALLQSEEGRELLRTEIERLRSFVNKLDQINEDPKQEKLQDDIRTLQHQHGHDRIIIFTQYTDTLKTIRENFPFAKKENVACYSGDGAHVFNSHSGEWETINKQEAKSRFMDDDGQEQILICTESASQGLNLQKCGVLINYDMPWNPMRVEQRNGRIDRIGQLNEEVKIINYFYEDSVETRIYDRLHERVGRIKNIVGDAQPILRDVKQNIRDSVLEKKLKRKSSDEEIDEAWEEYEHTADQFTGPDFDEVMGSDDSLSNDETAPTNHPDLARDGSDEIYKEQPPFEPQKAADYFIDHPLLRELGFQFTPIREIDESHELFSPSLPLDDIYKLTIPNAYRERAALFDKGRSNRLSAAGKKFDSRLNYAVTFDPETARKTAAVRFIMSGEPLFYFLVEVIARAHEPQPSNGQLIGLRRDGEESRTVPKPPWSVAMIGNGESDEQRLRDWWKAYSTNRRENIE